MSRECGDRGVDDNNKNATLLTQGTTRRAARLYFYKTVAPLVISIIVPVIVRICAVATVAALCIKNILDGNLIIMYHHIMRDQDHICWSPVRFSFNGNLIRAGG
jgi:hypothetical protein